MERAGVLTLVLSRELVLRGLTGLAHRQRNRQAVLRQWASGQFKLRLNRPACRGQRCALPTAPASAHLPTACYD